MLSRQTVVTHDPMQKAAGKAYCPASIAPSCALRPVCSLLESAFKRAHLHQRRCRKACASSLDTQYTTDDVIYRAREPLSQRDRSWTALCDETVVTANKSAQIWSQSRLSRLGAGDLVVRSVPIVHICSLTLNDSSHQRKPHLHTTRRKRSPAPTSHINTAPPGRHGHPTQCCTQGECFPPATQLR